MTVVKPICDDAALEPHQVLAAQVIRQALADLGDSSAVIRADARRFLEGSSGLAWWCAVAGLDDKVVALNAQPLLRRRRRVATRKAA